MKEQKGITLIALIITVIILLILAGTAISIAVNGDSLFTKASQARNEWNSSVATEQTEMDSVLSILNTITIGDEPVQVQEELPEGWNTTSVYRAYPSLDAEQKAPIPKGFVASQATGENTIAGGLVIYKGTTPVTDSNVATAQTTRDQYVWIPVDTTIDNWQNSNDWNVENDICLLDNSDWDDFWEEENPAIDETKEAALTLSEDKAAVVASIDTYGGFYIGRYELNFDGGSKKGQLVANSSADSSIGGVNTWYGLYDLAHQDITDGTNTVLKGHMMFGYSEYYAVLDFINSNNANYCTTPHESKQQTVAHLSGIIADGQTGKELDTVNNIVDLEGNYSFWSATAWSSGRTIYLGEFYDAANGYYGDLYENNEYNYVVASNTEGYSYTDSVTGEQIYNYYGTRQALYVI